MHAAAVGHTTCVRLLLELGADQDVADMAVRLLASADTVLLPYFVCLFVCGWSVTTCLLPHEYASDRIRSLLSSVTL
jgi:hypothetical protein